MPVTLRPAAPADLAAVTDVLLECWASNIAAVAPASAVAGLTPQRIAANWEAVLRGTDGGGALVATSEEGYVQGVTRFERDGDGTGVVQSLYVSPRAQRLGIGARLLSAAVKGLRDLGADTLTLWVISANAPSIAFYRAQGWIPDGARRVQPDFGVDETRLEYVGEANGFARLANDLVASGDNAPAGAAIGLRTPRHRVDGVAGVRGGASPMTPATSHDLASVTKIVATTTALIALVSAGDVRLDDPVKNYLPGFVGGGKDAVTVRDLLRHRGGLWEWQPLYLHGRKGPDALSYVERLPLRYGLDSARHYSDLGFILLGRIVEIASGTDLAAAVRQLVTEPMGLRHTRFARPVNDNVASSAYGDGVERRMVATGEPYPVASSDSPCHGGADAEQPDTAGEANTGAIERRIVATGEPYPVASSDSPCHGGADAEQPDTAGEANTGAAPSGLPSDGTATSNPLSHSGTNTHHPDAATEVGTSGAPSALLSDRLGPNGSPHQGETGLGQPSRALEAGPGRGRAGGVPVSENVGRDSAAFDGWRAHALVGEVNDGNAFHAFGGVSGHAGLFSTIGDLLRYATFLANFRDHASLWNPSVVEEFLADGPDPEQALGFRRYPLTIGGEMSTMYGHPGFVGCAVGFSPASGTALALCTNRLLARGEPLGTEAMWERVRRAAEVETSVSNRTGEANDE